MFDDMIDDNDLERDIPRDTEDEIFKNFSSFQQDILREMKVAMKDDGLAPDFATDEGLGSKDLEDYNCIFDKMEAEDNEVMVVPAHSEQILIMHPLDDFIDDIPEVKLNNFIEECVEEEKEVFDHEQQFESQVLEEHASPEIRQLAKSVYVPTRSEGNDLLSLEEKPEFLDN